jgi:hypothetical protein
LKESGAKWAYLSVIFEVECPNSFWTDQTATPPTGFRSRCIRTPRSPQGPPPHSARHQDAPLYGYRMPHPLVLARQGPPMLYRAGERVGVLGISLWGIGAEPHFGPAGHPAGPREEKAGTCTGIGDPIGGKFARDPLDSLSRTFSSNFPVVIGGRRGYKFAQILFSRAFSNLSRSQPPWGVVAPATPGGAMKKSIATPRNTETGKDGTGCKPPWPALS